MNDRKTRVELEEEENTTKGSNYTVVWFFCRKGIAVFSLVVVVLSFLYLILHIIRKDEQTKLLKGRP